MLPKRRGPCGRITRMLWTLGALWILLLAYLLGGGGALAAVRSGSLRGVLPDSILEVIFLDVRQGDAVLVRTPEGRAILVDGGPDAGAVADQLAVLGIEELDLVVATHPHLDHIGGLTRVLETVPVSYYMDGGVPHATQAYEALLRALEGTEVTYLDASPRTVQIGGLAVQVLPRLPGEVDDLNNASVALLLHWGEFRVMLTGDSEKEELAWLTETGLPTVTLLKAPHHGSLTGVAREFLEAVRPAIVVISVGAGNPYGHPDDEALRLYAAFAERVYRTDYNGRITVRGSRTGEWTAAVQSETPELLGASTSDSQTDRNPAAIPLRIHVHADAPGNDSKHANGEYVQLTNIGTEPLDLSDFTMCDIAMHCLRLSGLTLGPGESARVHSGSGENGAGTWFFGSSRAIWNNAGDTVLVLDSQGNLVVRHEY